MVEQHQTLICAALFPNLAHQGLTSKMTEVLHDVIGTPLHSYSSHLQLWMYHQKFATQQKDASSIPDFMRSKKLLAGLLVVHALCICSSLV